MNCEKSDDAVTGLPSVKEATAGSTANKVLKVVAVVLTVFVAVVLLLGSVLVVVPSVWRAYSALSGAGSPGGGAPASGHGLPVDSRDYYVVWVGDISALVVDDPEPRKTYRVETSGFPDIGAVAGDRVRLERPVVEDGTRLYVRYSEFVHHYWIEPRTVSDE